MRRRRGVALLVAAAAACHTSHPEAQPSVKPCRPPSTSLPHTASAAGLAGEYRLHLSATSGASAGQAADGALQLRPIADSAAREIVVVGVRDSASHAPLWGQADLDPAAVGATRTGALTAEDPDAPGVLVIERRSPRGDAAPEIVLRLGAEANRRGVARYDGGYFALSVRTIDPDGFTGTWSSGSGISSVGGYFCAERLSSKE